VLAGTGEVWSQQIGAALAEEDAARLLGLAPSEVSTTPGLLRLPTCDGGFVYPLLQFGRDHAQPPGLADVVQP